MLIEYTDVNADGTECRRPIIQLEALMEITYVVTITCPEIEADVRHDAVGAGVGSG